MDKALLARLETSRYGNKQSQTRVRPKGKKFPAGTCIRPDEIASSDEETEEDPVEQLEEDLVEEPEEDQVEEPEEDLVEELLEEEPEEVPQVLQQVRDALKPKKANKKAARKTANSGPFLIPGSYVVALYEEQAFLAEVSQDQSDVEVNYTRLNFMKINGMNRFIWGKPDILVTLNTDIIMKRVEPIPVNSRGCLGLKEADMKKLFDLQNQMVVLYSFSFLHSLPFFFFHIYLFYS